MSRITILPALFLVAACASDGVGLRPGVAGEQEVRNAMGNPALELRNPDGSRQMVYPSGPFGTRTLMVRLGRDGMFESVQQVLDEDHFYRIQPGLSRDDVLRLIGPPRQTSDFPRLQQEAWDYRFQDTWGYTAIFSVMFNRDGQVVGKFTRRLEREGRFR
jgi:outer membrane protein assembly factor BamE (lipoprotein component of BamABCDE complex)